MLFGKTKPFKNLKKKYRIRMGKRELNELLYWIIISFVSLLILLLRTEQHTNTVLAKYDFIFLNIFFLAENNDNNCYGNFCEKTPRYPPFIKQ